MIGYGTVTDFVLVFTGFGIGCVIDVALFLLVRESNFHDFIVSRLRPHVNEKEVFFVMREMGQYFNVTCTVPRRYFCRRETPLVQETKTRHPLLSTLNL